MMKSQIRSDIHRDVHNTQMTGTSCEVWLTDVITKHFFTAYRPLSVPPAVHRTDVRRHLGLGVLPKDTSTCGWDRGPNHQPFLLCSLICPQPKYMHCHLKAVSAGLVEMPKSFQPLNRSKRHKWWFHVRAWRVAELSVCMQALGEAGLSFELIECH